jgi:NAD(P)-dependent dehydrogenase (short-subunit alcohol dehydrogenase family)
MNLRGQAAIVTGGAVRLGRAIAHGLAAQGADVCIHCHRHAGLVQQELTELRANGVRAVAVAANFLEPREAARTVFARAVSELGPISILINSAAIFEPSTLGDLTPDHWQRHLAINLETPTFLCQEFAAQLPANATGKIVNIADWRGARPRSGHLAYTIAKSGLITLTRILAEELGPRIQVNAIAPGAILPGPGQTASEFQELGSRNLLQRTGTPTDVVEAVLYLVRAPFVTGEVLHVTGGEQLK